ncbi:MAG: hypothetical protein ABFC77_12875 [Thermoguttaceae bacterium]
MFKAMVWKEWREIRGIVLLALAVYAMLVVSTIQPQVMGDLMVFSVFCSGNTPSDLPFVNDAFTGHYWWISLALALTLGIRQTCNESSRGTYLFLLHRPASRRWLFWMKLLVGLAALLTCAAAPVLIYAVWAVRHAMLFEWPMTLGFWICWFLMIPAYLGAFLTGIRPGRWIGTRLLPMVAALVCVPIGLELFDIVPQNLTSFALLASALFVVLDVGLLLAIFFVVRTRDYA